MFRKPHLTKLTSARPFSYNFKQIDAKWQAKWRENPQKPE
jgi:hypothetical protein